MQTPSKTASNTLLSGHALYPALFLTFVMRYILFSGVISSLHRTWTTFRTDEEVVKARVNKF